MGLKVAKRTGVSKDRERMLPAMLTRLPALPGWLILRALHIGMRPSARATEGAVRGQNSVSC